MKTIAISLGLVAAACGSNTSESTSASTVDHYSYTPAGIPQLASPQRDGFGRATSVGGATLAYGPDGALARATRGSDVIEYITDESGNRLAKRVNGNIVEAYVDGAVVADTLYLPVHMGGATIGVIHHGAFESVATDARGTLLADGQGETAPAPFGERTRSSTLERVVDFAQSGRDGDLGVIRMGVRDYDPRSHQFLTPDPLFLVHPEKCVESPIECNLYSYARDRPADFIDPMGTEGSFVLSVGIEPFNVEFSKGTDSQGREAWALRVDGGVVSEGVQVGMTSKPVPTSEIGFKLGWEAKANIGPWSLMGWKVESKVASSGLSTEGTGKLLWTEGKVKLSENGFKVSGDAKYQLKLKGETIKEIIKANSPAQNWNVAFKAGPTAAFSFTVNSADAKTWIPRAKAWVQDHAWVWHPDQWQGHLSPFQFAGTRY